MAHNTAIKIAGNLARRRDRDRDVDMEVLLEFARAHGH